MGWTLLVVAAGGAVAHVPHGDVALAQSGQPLRREHLVHQAHVPVGGEQAVVIDHDAGALLSPVLQGVEGVVGQRGHIGGFRGVDPEHTAFFVQTAHLTRYPPSDGA